MSYPVDNCTKPKPPPSYLMSDGSDEREYTDDVRYAMMRHRVERQAAVDNLKDSAAIVSVLAAALIILWFIL